MLRVVIAWRKAKTMNKELQDFARKRLKEGLLLVTEGNRLRFKRMYSHTDIGLPINDIVDSMTDDSLDLAMRQVKNTLEKITEKGAK